ncbi:MAG: hypothetical protein JF595_12455 [Sphingomonadales bacterium]|nr:hypothetical protein [Sphingomonadales bacterium]
MTDRMSKAKRLDEMAAQESGLAKSQTLAAEADRLRRAHSLARSFYGFILPLLRN